ncbi:MAG: hypothetical protein PHY47_19545 [Lachnospiraceae bacterium]|nr:hypothetical protein [Lachnospiraceae bacterium]
MDVEKSLTQEEMIQELINLLKINNMVNKANDIYETAAYVDGLEQKLDQVMKELTTVKKQLADIQEQSFIKDFKESLSNMLDKMENRCVEIKDQIFEVKEQMTDKAKEIVRAVKQKGIEALNKVAEFVGIKAKLESIRGKIKEAVIDTNHALVKIDGLGSGIREAGQKVANTIRTFADKEELDYSQKEKKFSKTEVIKKPFFVKRKLLEGMELRLNAAIDKVDSLSKDVEISRVEKKSVDNVERIEGEEVSTAMLSMVAEQKNVYAAEPMMIETPLKQGKSR